MPPQDLGGSAISTGDDRDVIVRNEHGPSTQEYACSCTSVLPHGLGEVFGVEMAAEGLALLEAPAQSQARPRLHGSNLPLVVLDPNEQVLRVDDRAVGLTRTQFSILSYLIQNEGRWVTTGELIRQVLGTHHQPDTSLVRVHVHAIRRRLGSRAAWLESDRRRARGYRWRQFEIEAEDEPKQESS